MNWKYEIILLGLDPIICITVSRKLCKINRIERNRLFLFPMSTSYMFWFSNIYHFHRKMKIVRIYVQLNVNFPCKIVVLIFRYLPALNFRVPFACLWDCPFQVFFFFKSLVQHLLTHKCLVCHSNWSNSNGKNRFKSEKSSSKNVRFHRHRIKTNSKQLKWKKNGIYNGKKSVTYVEHLKQFDVAIKNRHYRVKFLATSWKCSFRIHYTAIWFPCRSIQYVRMLVRKYL